MNLALRSHWFTDRKEELYFDITTTLPRVGEVKFTVQADRYVYHGGEWSQWRWYPTETPAGVGPKTADTFREKCEPVLMAWLNGAEYANSRKGAVARWIVREAQERYGVDNAARMLAKFGSEITPEAFAKISQALQHRKEATALFEQVTGR